MPSQPPPDNLSDSYLQRFGGIARLYGQSGLEALHLGHFVVVGIGGVGAGRRKRWCEPDWAPLP